MILLLAFCLVIDPPVINRIQDDMEPSLHKVVFAQAETFEFSMTNSVTGIVPPLPRDTRVWMGWPINLDVNYLWSEIWHSTNGLNFDIYTNCAYTNFMIVNMDRWWTNTIALYDTNGNFIGWQTNPQNSDFFIEVDVERWNVRITNQLVISAIP